MLRSILHWTKFSDNITNLFLNKKKRNECFPLTLRRRQRRQTDLNGHQSSAHQELSLKNRQKNCHSIDVVVFTSSKNLSTKKPCSFLESLDISKQ